MGDTIGKIIGVIIAFILCIIAPITVNLMSDDMSDRRLIFNEMTTFVDEVIDVGQVTETQLKDFYYGVSSYGPACSVQIYRYIRTVQLDENNNTYTSYIPQDITTSPMPVKFNQGDLIKVHVSATNYTGAQQIGQFILGQSFNPIDYSLSGRVR